MDQNFLNFSRIIKLLHIGVWSLLFCAGGLLCQRVISANRPVAVAADEVAVAAHEQVPESPENKASTVTAEPTSATKTTKPDRRPPRRSVKPSEQTPKVVRKPALSKKPARTTPKTIESELEIIDLSDDVAGDGPTENPREKVVASTVSKTVSQVVRPREKSLAKTKKTPGKAVAKTETTSSNVGSQSQAPKKPVVNPSVNELVIEQVDPLLVVIENPKKIGYAVSFLHDDEQQLLNPGDQFKHQVIDESSSIAVRFDQGGDFGVAALDLKPGRYEFKVTSKGWKIVRKQQ